MQDFWLKKYPEEALELVTDKERKEIEKDEDLDKKEKNKAIDRLTRSKITEEQLNSFTPERIRSDCYLSRDGFWLCIISSDY